MSILQVFGETQAANQRCPTYSPRARIRPPGVSIQSAMPTRLTGTVQHEKYSELVARLIDGFQQRFEDFRKHTDIIKLLSDPFQVDPTYAAVKYQMELTEIQNDSDLKTAFSEKDLLSFDSGYVSSDSYPNLSQDSKNFTAMFGSTYCCEQLFLRMKNIRTKSRSLLTDEHLTTSLLVPRPV